MEVAFFYPLQLLTTLLENNPFVGSLDPKVYRDKLQELYNFVKENMPDGIREAAAATMGQDNAAADGFDLEQAALAAAIAEADIMQSEHGDELTESQQMFCVKVQALKYTESALDFIDLLEGATQALEGMLSSANTSDVTEALRFFVQARHFELPCAVTGMKRALKLMWSTEQCIRDEVLKAFVDVFIAAPRTDGGELLPDKEIARNLLVLTSQASIGELASIEEAVTLLVKHDRIPQGVFLVLWSLAGCGTSSARAATLLLLSMGASADRSIIDSKSRLKLLQTGGFGEYTQDRHDWRLAGAAAYVLQRMERAKVDTSDAKYLVLEQIMQELRSVASGIWCDDDKEADTLDWFSAAEEAVKALFVISPNPEVDCREIIHTMHASTLGGQPTCHPFRMVRFFHVIGQIALYLLIYTEALSVTVRRANSTKSLKKQEEADNAKNKEGDAANPDANSDIGDIEAELGMAQEAEAENERNMADIAEKEILGRGLLSVFVPVLVRVVGNEGGRFSSSEVLMQSSVLALCKFMCVSSKFCEEHLPLLFAALANAPAEYIKLRANTVVALGDLAFRFPNEVEPYIPRLYACLRDSSEKVRRQTLMVLTHLILNDMVKVKGQVCEIALCLRDDDSRICDMARFLFHELSKRSNSPIYNFLPDIFSQLSQLCMKKEDFRGIMSILLAFIKKERQNEMLCDKLCQRFPKATSIEQKADLTYCIAQLKVTEKSIKCLSDSFKMYMDALHDDEIRKSFMTIISKARKSVKPETKQMLDDWEFKLNDLAKLGVENEAVGEEAARFAKLASRRREKKNEQRASKKLNEHARELDLIAEGEETDSSAAPPVRTKPSTQRHVMEDDSSDDELAGNDLLNKENSNKKTKKTIKKAPAASTARSRRVAASS
jgi:condensin complex subunit 1